MQFEFLLIVSKYSPAVSNLDPRPNFYYQFDKKKIFEPAGWFWLSQQKEKII